MLIFDAINESGEIIPYVGEKFNKWLRDAKSVKIACPFISESSDCEIINALKDKNVSLICNLMSQGCNPFTIEAISKRESNCETDVLYSKNLHAKVYIFDDKRVVLGSANYSRNGMSAGTIEAACFLDAKNGKNSRGAIQQTVQWYENLKNSSEYVNQLSKRKWDQLKAQWNINKRYNDKILGNDADKISLKDLLLSGLDYDNIVFSFWSGIDDGYEKFKENVSDAYSLPVNQVDVLTDDLLDDDGRKNLEHENILLDRLCLMQKKVIFTFKTKWNKQLLTKISQIGFVCGYEFRKKNLRCKREECDSISLVYSLNPKTEFYIDSNFIAYVNERIESKSKEWEKLLDETFGYLTFAELRKFVL